MEGDKLREQFMTYVERMRKVRLLSTPSLEDVSIAEDYSRLLLSNFKKIGDYACENRIMLDETLFPLLNKAGSLTEEETENLNELNRMLADGSLATEIDLHLSELISDFLFRKEEKQLPTLKSSRNDIEVWIRLLERRVDILYTRLYYCGRSNPHEWQKLLDESVTYYVEAFSYLDRKVFPKLSEKSRDTLIMLAINGTSMYNTRPQAPSSVNMELATAQKKWLDRISDILDEPFYKVLLTEESLKKAKLYIHSYIAAFGLIKGLSQELYKEAHACAMQLEKEWAECPNLAERELFLLSIRELQLYTSFYTNSPEFDRSLKNVIDIYEKRNAADYSYSGIIPNLSIGNVLFLVLSGLKQQHPYRLTEKMEGILYGIPMDVIRYLFKAPKRENLGQYVNALSSLLESFVELPGGIQIHNFCIHSMAAMHPPTYIHSNMVAKICVCLCRHLIFLKPEVFCGFPGCDTVEKVLENQSKILEYAWYAALFHDIGKLYIIDTIAMYGRRLLDSEFELIQSHPDRGADLAERFESTRNYVDVIRGHHIWYDGSRGYPDDFDISKSPYRMIIDIVSVSDSLDAATDGVGRSYRVGKTLDDFQKELEETAGRRYAPYMADIFKDQATHEDLVYLLEHSRKDMYKDTYYKLKELLQK